MIPVRTLALAGGGTGGHLFPGIAVAKSYLPPGDRPLLFGSGRALESRWVGEAAEAIALDAPNLPGRLADVPRYVLRLARAMAGSLRILGARRARLVVGLGGFASVAPGLAALASRRPLLLLEQNAVPGKANRLLSALGGRVAASFADALPKLSPGARRRARVLGNPVRPEVLAGRRDPARYGLAPDRPTLLVTGGSQGAGALNRALLTAGEELSRAGVQVLALTGVADEEPVRERLRASGVRAFVAAFRPDMGDLYRTADLVLARAGGTTLAELAVLGRPSILVPYAHHGDRHQDRNAEVFARAGAARIVPEGELTGARLAREATDLLGSADVLGTMAAAALSLGVPDAAERVAGWAKELVAGRGGNGRAG
ncbi:MAG: UDP-N-acetylglucosamine--N-acetylmuramyl-(pentapeptide) pyrophosphoryl-undecaprenol N-acetylglucosamine transferase [Planctomycetes bacterium]|jgi:UDP-N-acetylglucosamine--N-acetylmuramyl-(pentapeptide) pyrophosphoryl-undecaprenol N-acetylglucosamine transferase|nr:UDP-N-acetylglucosamine--N-acetylmuramyl-(pentapeptide) pyrophosphoryl-undecaprenol N-acetylglucosamine transferase [Planctomycetota bacterium]